MLIPDSLRQEHMPLMVYAMCKAAKYETLSEEEIIKAVTASRNMDDKDSLDVARPVKNYAKTAGFITIDSEGICRTDFEDFELLSPSTFSMALLKRIELDQSERYVSLLKWLFWRGQQAEYLENHADIRSQLVLDKQFKDMKLSEDTVHGFLFWTEFLGIVTSAKTMGRYYFSIETILLKCLRNEKIRKKLETAGNMPTEEFLDLLSEEVFFIPLCYENNNICYALTLALRILAEMNVIEMNTVSDSPRVWHLYDELGVGTMSSFTNVKVISNEN